MSAVETLRQRSQHRIKRAAWIGLLFCVASVALLVVLIAKAVWRWA